MTVILSGTVADPAQHAMTASLCAVAVASARPATTTVPRGALASAAQRMMAAGPCAAATRHPMTANLDATVADPARPATAALPWAGVTAITRHEVTATLDAPVAPAPHRRPTSSAPHHSHTPHHRTPLPVTHPKGTPCR
ncbi:hypothetical protein OG194_29360 [Streptomyces sp. NBC_01288]|uniref:hypothetical protein n=1 Tax=Streptomyces sp. NBC_01288 TaxID=2903814 RepID=UPI002E13D10C|nr:hypothetical protein OG194_29360 [Streptomyces sp. NBC_01288]